MHWLVNPFQMVRRQALQRMRVPISTPWAKAKAKAKATANAMSAVATDTMPVIAPRFLQSGRKTWNAWAVTAEGITATNAPPTTLISKEKARAKATAADGAKEERGMATAAAGAKEEKEKAAKAAADGAKEEKGKAAKASAHLT